jgi:hypothetical protein
VLPLTEPPRDALTATQVTDLIKCDSLEVVAGLELVNADLTAVTDISDRYVSGTVKRSNFATIHGTYTLRIQDALPWGSARVLPYLTLTDTFTGMTARFDRGVYLLETPVRVIGESPEEYDVEGYDPLLILDVEILDPVILNVGDVFTDFAAQLLDDHGAGTPYDITASTATAATAKIWQPDGQWTWLTVLNDVFSSIGYRSLWADWHGRYRGEPYVLPSVRGPEWTYDADELKTIVGEDRKVTADYFKAPNRWKFIRNNPAAGFSDGTTTDGTTGVYEVVNQSDGPTSIDERGDRTIPARVLVDAVDDDALIAFGDQRVEQDKRIDTNLEFSHGPNPLHWHFDVVTYSDAAYGGPVKGLVHEWSEPQGEDDGTILVRRL